MPTLYKQIKRLIRKYNRIFLNPKLVCYKFEDDKRYTISRYKSSDRANITIELTEAYLYELKVLKVFVCGVKITTGVYCVRYNVPNTIRSLFIPQLIYDLTNNIDVDTAINKFNESCDSITVEEFAAATKRPEVTWYAKADHIKYKYKKVLKDLPQPIFEEVWEHFDLPQ